MPVFQKITNRVSRMSVKTKLAGAIFVCAMIAVALGQYSQFFERRASAIEAVSERYGVVGQLFSAQLVAATQFQDADRLRATTDRFVEQDSSVAVVQVLNQDGNLLYAFEKSPEHAAEVTEYLNATDLTAEAIEPVANLERFSIYTMELPIAAPGRDAVGTLQLAVDVTSIRAEVLQDFFWGAGRSALAALLALGLIVMLVGRVVTRPVLAIGKSMDAIANHDYNSEVPYMDRNDEVGLMAKRLAKFRDQLAADESERDTREKADKRRQQLFVRLAEGLSEIADGRVDRPIDINEFSDLGENSLRICKDFNDVLTNLRSVLSTVMQTAETVRSSAEEISESVVDQSKRSEAQAVTLEESAAAIETLSSSVEQTAEHASEANERITQNRQQAQAGGEVVEQTVEAMRNIEESSDQISAITGVIDDIAFQTNLLALNAGVEAARAGEAGRGFAVVASEVRALAQRASDSANEIKELILRSGEQVTKGSQLVNKAGDALEEIINGVNHASDLVSQIATGSRDQADNLREIKDSVTELDRVTQRNAAMIEESSAASRNLSDDAAKMTSALKVFKLSEADMQMTASAAPAATPAAPAPTAKPKAEAKKAEAKAPKPAPVKAAATKIEKPKSVDTGAKAIAAKTKEWDEDAALDANETKAKSKPSPKKPAAAKKPVETPEPQPVSKASAEEPVLKFSARSAPKKMAVNQSMPEPTSEDWEDF